MSTTKFSRGKTLLFTALLVLFMSLTTMLFLELGFRYLEYQEGRHDSREGNGGLWVDDTRWGWKPGMGPFKVSTSEFTATGQVNEAYMNDAPVDVRRETELKRILTLGDSHTFATGVSTHETWPKVLESLLNSGKTRYRVYNAGTTGYSLHQYLLRLMDQGPVLKPDVVLVGLSFATDLYDLLPPERGGWIYGGDRERDYFDFNKKGILELRHWKSPSAGAKNSAEKPPTTTAARRARQILDHAATFRYLRRSKLALAIGSHVKINGQTFWPNMEIVVEKQISDQHRYQVRLFEAILTRMKVECDSQKCRLVVVSIPYLAQVYDDIWDATFGKRNAFSRTAACERLRDFCKTQNIDYVETLDEFRAVSQTTGHWLHFRKDAHPTPEGHVLIARTVQAKAFETAPRIQPNATFGK